MNEADESFVFLLDRGLAVVPIPCHIDAMLMQAGLVRPSVSSGRSRCSFVDESWAQGGTRKHEWVRRKQATMAQNQLECFIVGHRRIPMQLSMSLPCLCSVVLFWSPGKSEFKESS